MAQVKSDESGSPRHASYDVVVIGAGAGGICASVSAARFGARTLLVEQRPVTGGDCTWTGCVPSKALLRCAKAAKEARTASRFGVNVTGVTVDFAAVREHIANARRQIYDADDSPEALQAKGVEVLVSTKAQFLSATKLQLTNSSSAIVTIEAKKVIICVGAEPAVPPVGGLTSEQPGGGEVPQAQKIDTSLSGKEPPVEGLTNYKTSDTIWSVETLPRAMIVLGGGPIGCELAQAFARLGTQVTLLGRVLPRESQRASELVEASMKKDGVLIHAAGRVSRVIRVGEDVTVEFSGGAENVQIERCDEVLVATGRSALRSLEALDVTKAGVKLTKRGLAVDAYLRAAPTVFAAGDCIGGLQFTHLAIHQAGVAAWNATAPSIAWQRGPSDDSVPRCTFTDPEVATVGFATVAEAAAADAKDPRETVADMKSFDRAVCDGAPDGYVSIVHSGPKGVILGATACGHGAGELLAELALARKKKLTVADVATTMHPYPSMAFGLQIMAGHTFYDWVENACKHGTTLKVLRLLSPFSSPRLRGKSMATAH